MSVAGNMNFQSSIFQQVSLNKDFFLQNYNKIINLVNLTLILYYSLISSAC